MSEPIMEQCAACGKPVYFRTEEERQAAYLRGATPEILCAEHRYLDDEESEVSI